MYMLKVIRRGIYKGSEDKRISERLMQPRPANPMMGMRRCFISSQLSHPNTIM